MPRVIEVIESEETRGDGTPKKPYRIVKTYWTLEGEFLAEFDMHEQTEPKSPNDEAAG